MGFFVTVMLSVLLLQDTYTGDVKKWLDNAKDCVWDCMAADSATAHEPERRYRVSSKQYVEDAYIYLTGSSDSSETL